MDEDKPKTILDLIEEYKGEIEFPEPDPPDTDIDDILRNKMSYEERLLRSSKLFFASQNLKAGMVYKTRSCNLAEFHLLRSKNHLLNLERSVFLSQQERERRKLHKSLVSFEHEKQASYVELLNDLDQLKLLGKDIQMNENEVRERLGHYVKSVRSARWPKADNTVVESGDEARPVPSTLQSTASGISNRSPKDDNLTLPKLYKHISSLSFIQKYGSSYERRRELIKAEQQHLTTGRSTPSLAQIRISSQHKDLDDTSRHGSLPKLPRTGRTRGARVPLLDEVGRWNSEYEFEGGSKNERHDTEEPIIHRKLINGANSPAMSLGSGHCVTFADNI